MSKWENGKMRKWENGKVGEWENEKVGEWCFWLFEPAGVEGVVVGYSLNFAFDVGL
jgi:hypothetical protein